MGVRLHVNVDHVATLRQARGTPYPDPVEAALRCERAGAHGITVHLREDRRHIQDADVEALRRRLRTLLNLEMAATDDMVAIALRIRPDIVTLVPERRQERTTEGGLDVVGQHDALSRVVDELQHAHIAVHLFVEPDPDALRAALRTGARGVELHTGAYAAADAEPERTRQLQRLATAGRWLRAESTTVRIAAGHGLTLQNVGPLLRAVPEIEELNIGHALVSDAVFVGLDAAVGAYLAAIAGARP
ncbi:MAG: pyridoxine 5'-phosphate synthase [Myxococcota bacterium]|nr:pyridoxine 5'-phosphate synthase [Myxococcota bacterium]MDW8363981.1 pyridoxine 5'-phosphate synthase [Myxococcales bacterium]